MKFTIAIIALASTAFAAPAPAPGTASTGSCTPATYACLDDNSGWQVCNTSGKWVFAGDCPPQTECKFYPVNGSPYCVPPGFTFKKA